MSMIYAILPRLQVQAKFINPSHTETIFFGPYNQSVLLLYRQLMIFSRMNWQCPGHDQFCCHSLASSRVVARKVEGVEHSVVSQNLVQNYVLPCTVQHCDLWQGHWQPSGGNIVWHIPQPFSNSRLRSPNQTCPHQVLKATGLCSELVTGNQNPNGTNYPKRSGRGQNCIDTPNLPQRHGWNRVNLSAKKL